MDGHKDGNGERSSIQFHSKSRTEAEIKAKTFFYFRCICCAFVLPFPVLLLLLLPSCWLTAERIILLSVFSVAIDSYPVAFKRRKRVDAEDFGKEMRGAQRVLG